MKKTFLLLLMALLCLALLTACGGAADDPAGEPAAEEAAEQDLEFLLGSWFAQEASVGDETKDPYDVFGGTFSLYFSDNGECTMAIDQQRAIVNYELTDNGVVLTGDGVYEATFDDAERKTMTLGIPSGDIMVNVLLEKYEE
ncbi:MAG: hypothetical protein IKD93_07050 [Firmicutes bacterium]|nr:hypothetical protein [Bacillota bacterium]